jgi:hypothetical protein
MKEALDIRDGAVQHWRVPIDDGYVVRAADELTDEEASLSGHSIWNDTLLAQRIASHWSPNRHQL